jgi:uroporphyrinogen decarboxylase
VWILIWDNAAWHKSQAVRSWVQEHNRQVKASGQGVRIWVCLLPLKSPWLNPIEPQWAHGKRRVVEPDRPLAPQESGVVVIKPSGIRYENEPCFNSPTKIPLEKWIGALMKHRDRVLTVLNHELPDRCPMQVSFTPEFANRLREDLNIQGRKVHNPHGGGNTYALERAVDQDLILTSVGWANAYYQEGDSYSDEWGVTWRSQPYDTPFGTGQYTEMVTHPLADERTIASYRCPDPARPELYDEAARVIRDFKDEYWIVGVTVTTIFETAWALRGYEQMLIDFVSNPDLAEAILNIPYQYHLAAARRLVEMGVDMIWIGDDVGMQTGMLISPRTWCKYFKPKMANFIAVLKHINPEVKIAYHTDGNVSAIIPDLVEIGLDVLNPIQPACMDPEKLKRAYGDRLCFWGSIDEQHTLPFGTPQDVRNEVILRLKTIGKSGGLILGPTHHVQLDTPMNNFWAMVNTITETPYSSII